MATNQDGFTSSDPAAQAKLAEMRNQVVAKSSQASTLSPEDAANAAKYSTPLPPNDPASLRGSREDQNYLGPTNFGKLQQKYTPYQIEQATTRNEAGDIFWKEGVDINKIPPSASGNANLQQPSTANVMGTDNASTSSVSMSSPVSDSLLGRQQAEAATKYLTGISATIDGLLATQQKMVEDAKKEAEGKVSGLMDRLRGNLDKTQYETRLERDRELFKVEDNIKTLGVIRGRLADATAALESGLIYEEGRPVRMQLLTGRMSELKKQGIAQINALSGAAEVIKGNIDLARAYADDSLAAIKADNAEKNAALNTLLDLENAKLIKLSDEEKSLIKERRGLLEDESARVEKDKDAVFDLAVKYPQSFAKAGVTFLDSPEAAAQKMLPFMSEREQLELEAARLDLAEKRADIAKTNRAGAGGGGSDSAILASLPDDIRSLASAAFNEGVSLDQFLKDVNGLETLSKKQLDSLQDFWSTVKKPPLSEVEKDLAGVADADWLARYSINSSSPDFYRFSTMTKGDVLKELQNRQTAPVARRGFLESLGGTISNFFRPTGSTITPKESSSSGNTTIRG